MTTDGPLPSRPSRFRRGAKRLLVAVLVPYVAVVVLLTVFQRSMLYVPARAANITLPVREFAQMNADVRDVQCETVDGLTLHGWHVTSLPFANEGSDREEQHADRLLVLFFSGNAGHRGYRVDDVRLLFGAGADVLICDYRGYAENPGAPTEEGLAVDARAAWRYATEKLRIEPKQVVLFGESLGGAVAIRLTEELCGEGRPPAGLITRSTFSSLTDAAAEHYPWVPVGWLLFDKYPSDARIARVTCPLLMLHGSRDTIVPCTLGRKLFEAAPEKSANGRAKQFVELASADHNDVLETEGPAFRESVHRFLEPLTPQRPAPLQKKSQPVFQSIERNLVYHPDRVPRIDVRDAGLPAGRVHAVTVTTEDGLQLNGWHLLPEGAVARDASGCDRELARSGPVAIFFSGNGGNRTYRVEESSVLTGAGAHVFLFDYRGYGENPGSPNERAIAADAKRVWRYVTEERRIVADRVILYGESLGGGVAVGLATELCQVGTPPAGLVLRSTFTSLTAVASHHYPLLPVKLVMAERYPSVERIGEVTCPILVIHGRKDTIVPFQFGEKLFAAAPEKSASGIAKRFVELPAADHNDVLWTESDRLVKAVSEFLKLTQTR